MKRVLITGATGMVGSNILQNCLKSSQISEVVSLVRKASGKAHPKLIEVSHNNFTNFEEVENHFCNIDIAFFCIGVYTGAVSRDEFRKITINFPDAFGNILKKHSPSATFCLLSGMGADQTEKSKVAFALDKGIAENKILRMRFPQTYLFRPGYIYPILPREEPNFSYKLMRYCYPFFRLIYSNGVITSEELANVMFNVAITGYKKPILENRDMKKLLKDIAR
jgi:uncharacterized protein YbjT (DUF2867 family)